VLEVYNLIYGLVDKGSGPLERCCVLQSQYFDVQFSFCLLQCYLYRVLRVMLILGIYFMFILGTDMLI